MAVLSSCVGGGDHEKETFSIKVCQIIIFWALFENRRANGYHWKSGQFGLGTQTQLLSHNKENVGKVRLSLEFQVASCNLVCLHEFTLGCNTENPLFGLCFQRS